MLPFKDKYQFAKKEVLKIIIALSALMIVSLIYYFHIRQEALFVAGKRAEATLKNTEMTISIRMEKIETIVNSIQPMVEYALDNPDAMFDIARHTVESSSQIMGSGIAFKEGYYPEKGRWFEVYVGYQKGDDTLVARQIGGPNHDYLQKVWFQEGMASQKGIWSDPYYDNAGGMTFLMTYSVPVRNEDEEVVGLICADIAVDTFVSIIRGIKLYPNSFCTLVAGDGTTLVPPPSKTPKGKCHVFSEEIDGKNLTLTITIPDADMYKRLRQSTAFFVILALSGILTVLFISYRSVRNLWKLNEVRAKEQHIEDELAIARHIQQSLLPSSSLPDIAQKVDISGLQVPAKFVGGDLYDYYIRDNKLIFCIGDVSGKGVPAALLMAIAHSLFRTISAHSDQPDRITRELNRSISDNNPDIMFITTFLGVLDLETGLVTYCNAGHNPPILIQSGEAGYLELADNLLIGVEKDTEYSSRTLQLGDGDTLFLYTDGLTEAENTPKELFGEERALEIAQKLCGASAEEQIKAIQSAVMQFVGDAEQSDDLTLLAIRYISTKEQLTLTNDIQELERLEPFLENFFNRNNLDMTLLPSVNLALEEALANVIMYAYPKGVQGEVTLSTNIKGKDILMEIKDEGAPFDPLQQQEANLDVPLEERQIGGLGIHLIKEIMNEVNYVYKDGKNVLTMTYDVGLKT